MYSIKYVQEENRVYVRLTGFLTLLEISDYNTEFKAIHKEVKPGWTLLVDTRGLAHLSDESFEEINRVREFGVATMLRKSAVIVDSLENMIRTDQTLQAIENPFEENYFLKIEDALDYLNK